MERSENSRPPPVLITPIKRLSFVPGEGQVSLLTGQTGFWSTVTSGNNMEARGVSMGTCTLECARAD
jgi:hypothetical protein